jgi:hypothetical protein
MLATAAFLAAWLRRVFGDSQPAQGRAAILEAQLEHHRTRTFQEECRELLRKHGIDFDERYVWD